MRYWSYMQVSTKIEAYRLVNTEHPTWKWVVCAVQVLAYPLFVGIRLLVVRNKLQRHAELIESVRNNDRAFIIYSNHQSKLDPFIICASLPFQVFVALLPFRFFIENSYLKRSGNKLLLGMFGGFPAHFHPMKPYGLDHARQSLSTNQSVVIFPQGMRTRKQIAKPGIAILANEPGISLIPIKIEWRKRLCCEVSIGKAFEVTEFEDADSLMDTVYQLD